ncbi:MAG: metallophosphoesterase [Anaerolineae bacterium]
MRFWKVTCWLVSLIALVWLNGWGFGSFDTAASAAHFDPALAASAYPLVQSQSATDTIRFAVIGDYGSGTQDELKVANLVKSWEPDFIITVGDNNYPLGEARTIDQNIGQYYHDYIYPYTGTFGAGIVSNPPLSPQGLSPLIFLPLIYGPPFTATNHFFPALGNHDWYTSGATPYLDYFTLPGNERYYDFVRGPVHFFAVDSDSSEPDGITSGSTQGVWLQNRLTASTACWKLVYFHHAPYSSGPHGSNTTLQWPFQSWGADAVLSGHDHTYERVVINNFPYFVNGLGGYSRYAFEPTPIPGSQVRYNANFGAMLVTATPSAIIYQFITVGGIVVDTYSQAGGCP